MGVTKGDTRRLDYSSYILGLSLISGPCTNLPALGTVLLGKLSVD